MSDGYDIPAPPPHPETGPAPEQPGEETYEDTGIDLKLVECISMACHEANRALQIFIASDAILVSPHWEDLDDETRASSYQGVVGILQGNTPAQSHEGWVKFKVDHGWTYGPVKDEEAKTHPNIVPYGDLPLEEKRKDALFHAVVRHMVPVDPKPALAAFLVVIDEQGKTQGIVDPHDISKFELDHTADYGEVWRASMDLAHDIDVMMHSNATVKLSSQVLPGSIIDAMNQMAAAAMQAQENEEIRKQLILDQKGGHRAPGGGPRRG